MSKGATMNDQGVGQEPSDLCNKCGGRHATTYCWRETTPSKAPKPPDGYSGWLDWIVNVGYYMGVRRDAARAELSDLRARLATATELVRELEWARSVPVIGGDGAPVCYANECPICYSDTGHHKPDCKLAAFLEGCKADNPEQSK